MWLVVDSHLPSLPPPTGGRVIKQLTVFPLTSSLESNSSSFLPDSFFFLFRLSSVRVAGSLFSHLA